MRLDTQNAKRVRDVADLRAAFAALDPVPPVPLIPRPTIGLDLAEWDRREAGEIGQRRFTITTSSRTG
jgi:hypothetical protein